MTAARGTTAGETSSAFGVAEDDDPRIRRVYQRLRRLTIVAALTMGVGFLAIMSVIAYRVVKAPPKAAPADAAKLLALPAGAKVVATAVDAGRIVVTVEREGGTTLHVFDAASLMETGRLEIGPGVPAAPPIR